MKYCVKCGSSMEDDALFCPKCGTSAGNQTPEPSIPTNQMKTSKKLEQSKSPSEKPRKGMKILGIVCFVFAVIYALMSAMEPFMLGMTGFFAILGVMFFVLAKSPKSSIYILGKQSGLKKKLFVIICVVLAFVVCGIVGIKSEGGTTSGGQTSDEQISDNRTEDNQNSQEPKGFVCDVTQFANITGEELIALLGEPDSIEDGTCTGTFEIPCTYYEYDNSELLGEVSFDLVNDSVVRVTSYNEYQYAKGKNIFERFGIVKGENCATAADTGVALRYRWANDGVDDFWVNLIEEDTDTFGFLQVTYDMQYFEEWYLPMSIEEMSNYQYWTQETVKGLLKAPKTADFPNINHWAIVKNDFYVAAQSYVDAQNSFGAEIRSEFTFIYRVDTSSIVYAVFDGEVIADNGYVPTADLIVQQVG